MMTKHPSHDIHISHNIGVVSGIGVHKQGIADIAPVVSTNIVVCGDTRIGVDAAMIRMLLFHISN